VLRIWQEAMTATALRDDGKLEVEPPPRPATVVRDPLGLPVLVLNRLYQPVRITSARRAFGLLYTGSARVLAGDGELLDFHSWRSVPASDGDDVVAVIDGALRVPRIVRLFRYSRVWRPLVRLSRRNLMLRDAFVCQYCGRRRPARELDIDHVHPRSRGGEDTWANLVTACQPCNRRKGWRTPQEANMPLLRRPDSPHWTLATQLLVGASCRYDEWDPFLEAC
jgi:hypothetical protein